ncbi:Xaa-Pro peptidase family protein [uncultured Thermanaerothrix sp.]|uniref:M24 family metallopeptidase n=1 Tax=uncultured Thermanaerothrix sp. TaxID=1195149 RepID=UPI002633B8AE|nr:Xaa-Pro peptidase family protein [uncultured Thermanaerothrix sp.]
MATTLERLLDSLRHAGLDALVLIPGPNFFYLTRLQMHLLERPIALLLIPGESPRLVVPAFEIHNAEKSSIDLQVVPYPDDPMAWEGAFTQAVRPLQGKSCRIGVEPTRLRFLELSLLQKVLPTATFLSAEEALSSLRIQKSDTEIADLRKAVAIAQTALQATLPAIRPGVSEREIASELYIQLLRAGSEPVLPFAPIVASGPNAANPHATPGDRLLQLGDVILIDWGATWNGYCADLTRVFALGNIPPDLKVAHEIVMTANQVARSKVRPGIPTGEIDRAARSVIERAGYGTYFTHRTGHGLGLEAHEPPYIYTENTLSLAVGMVFTIEPGLYFPGLGGIRIEDNVVVTETGCLTLSDFPRELINLLE